MIKLSKLSKNKSYCKHIVIFIFVILAIIVSIPLLLPYHYYRYLKCGTEPVKVVPSAIGSQYGYYVAPSSAYYQDETVFIAGYYCTEKDARDAGYPNGYLPDGSRSGDASPL